MNTAAARHQRLGGRRAVSPLEGIAVVAVISAAIAIGVWFIFFSSGGIGPGTV